MAFRRVADADALWEGEMRGLSVDGQKLLLLRIDGQVHAYEDRCAHLGVALSEGRLDAGVVTCAAHHYQYDARTGQGVNPRSVRIRKYPVSEEGSAILVDLDGSCP